MAMDPDIILADEPTGALDTETGRLVMDLFHKLNRERGKTIVLITHNPELAAETDRILTISDGRIIGEKINRELAPRSALELLKHGGTAPASEFLERGDKHEFN